MEKQRKPSLTTFNFQTTEDSTNDEGVLSKIFDKVLGAVSGPIIQDSTSSIRSNNSNKLDRNSIYEHENSTQSAPHNVLSKHTATSSSSCTTASSIKDPSLSNFPTSLLEPTTPQSLTSTTATTTTTVTVGNHQPQKLNSNESNSTVQFIVPNVSKSQEHHDPLEYLFSSPLTKRKSIDSDTQSVVTNFSISNTNSLGKILARLRGQKNDKEFWMPDEQCKECYKCRKPFTLLRRKHHCRTCGQIFCARCASHVISGKIFKQKGQVRVCNFCYAEQVQQLKKSSTDHNVNADQNKLEYSSSASPLSKQSMVNVNHHDESKSSPETTVDQQKPSPTSFASPIIPFQKPPLAAPQMQIPTTGLKQAHSTYGNDDTPTFALEIPTNSSSPQHPTVEHMDSPVIPAITTTGPTDGLKRLFDAGTSLLKRPRSNTSSSAPLFEYSPYWDRGGGTILAESELSPYPGTMANVDDFFQDQLHHHPHHYSPSQTFPPPPPPPPLPPPMFHSKSSMLYQHLNPFNVSDDESYDLRMKRAEELRGEPEPTSLRRRSLTGSNSSGGTGNKRLKSINQQKIRTQGLPSASKASFEEWSPSPFLTDESKMRLRLPPRQRRLSGPPQTIELSQSARAHARNILRQLMQTVQLDNKEEWEQVMMNILLKVTTHVQPDIRAGDDMDVRHYVKIKKLPGGLPSDSFYVRGVACTKNVAHKRMMKNISHPRILILLFSLDYSRVEMENQLLSIAPVISQEREHIKKLVGRIVALKPSLLIVKSTVSRLALEFLLEANIPVIHNLKHSVIEAIARCTQASIVTSVDKLQNGLSFGRCGSFEIRTILHEWIPNRRKTYLIFDDCAPELGGTIVLRGEKLQNLRVIKRLIDFMVFVVNNLKLETSLLLDSFAKNRSASDTEHTLSLTANESDLDGDVQTVNSHYINHLLKRYQTTILSVSQFVVYPPPYLLMALKETEDKLACINQQRRRKSLSGSSIVTNATTLNTARDSVPTSASPTRLTFDKQSDVRTHIHHTWEDMSADTEYELVAKSHQLSRTWDAYIGENPEAISPFYHQNIVVLYSNVCTVTTVPCQGPEIRIFGFYRYPSDKTLGQYLIDLCTDARQPCSSFMCDYLMLQHYRSYANGNARINVMTEPFPCPLPGMSDKLLMWSYCKECNKPTPVLPMSENTWNYSFGKFLEILLYQQGVHCRADICPHDMVRNHVRYFGYNDLAVRFQYDPIELLEVSPPPMRVFIHSKLQRDLKDQELKSLRSKINKFYQSIQERNKNFPFDLVDPRKLESCKTELQEMSLEAQGEKKDALQLLQNVYATSDPMDTLTIQVVYRNLFQVVQHWDVVYTDFVQFYLQPERELKKLTTTQLRKMFPAEFTETTTLDNIGSERTKQATEVTDLPIAIIGLDSGDDEKDSKTMVMPLLLSSPSSTAEPYLPAFTSNPSNVDSEEQPSDQKKSFLKPEIRRRLSLELMRELDEKSKYTEERRSSTLMSLNRLNPNKFLRMKSPGALSATFTPSRIPIPRPPVEAFHRYQFNSSSPPLDLNRSALKGKQHSSSPSKSKKDPRLRHHRHHSIGHSQQIHHRGDEDDDVESESSHHYLRRSVTTNKRFRSRLPRKKTYIQVYTQANDLVQEDMDDEFGSGRGGLGADDKTRRYSTRRQNRKYRHVIDTDADNDMSDDSSDSAPAMDYFSSLAPFASKVVEKGELPEVIQEKAAVKSPVSLPRSYSRSYFPFSDGFSSGMSGDDECDLPSASDLLKIQQQIEDGNLALSGLHNIHPDMINNPTKTSLSETTSLEEIRHSAEKISFMKTLTNLLTDSGIGNLLPLESPLLPREYLFPDSYVVVKEDEPSTIIAYTLSSEDYIDKMHDIQDYSSDQGSHDGTVKQGNISIKAPSEVTLEAQNADDIQETLLKESGTHMRYNFSTGSTKFFCKIFFSEQFDALRRNCGCDESYIMSLASCIKWDSSGGKSGSAFLKTKDDRFLMKQMSKYELDAFLGFAPAYFQYMSEAFFSELPTVLAKILGFYSIGYKNSATGKSMRMDVLVMENLFYQRNVKKIFDLKGSMRNRHVQSTGKQDEVLLDENLVELIYQSPLFIRAHSKEILRSSLHNDTLFLSNRNVMDYSLLVGIDEERQELVVGIVDFIRTFTWDKKLESWVKETGILGGGGKEPTIVSPRQYRIRFREAMERYFLMVPDFWALSRQSRTPHSALHHDIVKSATDEE